MVKNNKSEDDESDGGTSSEEIAEPPTKVSKKELEAIISDSPAKRKESAPNLTEKTQTKKSASQASL